MKNTLRTVIFLIVGILALTSCGAGYFITSEPDVLIYDDYSYNNIQLLRFLYYGRYYGEPYYYRSVPPPPPNKPAPPKHDQPRSGIRPNSDRIPPTQHPNRSGGGEPPRSGILPNDNRIPPTQNPNRSGGGTPRSGGNTGPRIQPRQAPPSTGGAPVGGVNPRRVR